MQCAKARAGSSRTGVARAIFTATAPPKRRKSRERLVFGLFPPILPGQNESEPPVTRKFALVLLSHFFLALALAGGTAAWAQPQEKGAPAPVALPAPAPLPRPSI